MEPKSIRARNRGAEQKKNLVNSTHQCGLCTLLVQLVTAPIQIEAVTNEIYDQPALGPGQVLALETREELLVATLVPLAILYYDQSNFHLVAE